MSEKIYGVSLETIAALADIVKEKDLGEITLTDGDKTITVKGKKCPPPIGMPPMPPIQQDMMPVTMNAAAKDGQGVPDVPHASDGNLVKSPIVGTFYASPAPDKPPFVTVGARVKKGDVVMIIESMKLMNEITAEQDGVITEVCAENGQVVDFGCPLFRMKKETV